ncbi:MAG: glycosyltransferase [bacterium]
MSAPEAAPFFSVIVPVLDGGAPFAHCLAALAASSFQDRELIVVDDGSRDGSAELARRHGARVLATAGRCGPAAARNLGARVARGTYLFFVDADCEIAPDAFERAARRLAADPSLDGIFGAYDDAPAAPGWVAQVKNLHHHFVHHANAGSISTFWAGCGAVRRTTFEAVGGFDSARYPGPAIEDIELGYRIHDAGGRVILAPEIQAKHWKAWTLASVTRSDLCERGIPWMQLVCSRRATHTELNLAWRARACAAAVALAAVGLAAAPALPWLASGLPLAAIVVAILERDFLGYVGARKGARLAGAALVFLLIHHFVASLAALLGGALYLARERRATRAVATRSVPATSEMPRASS